MIALAPIARVRARHHPVLVAMLWLVELAAAALVIWPVGAIVRSAFGAHPRGDAVLFDDGGMALLDFLARALPAAAASLSAHVLVTIPLAFLAMVVAFGSAIVTLGAEVEGTLRARGRRAVDQSFSSLRALTVQSLLVLVAQILVLVFAGLIFAGTAGAFAGRFGVATADRIGFVVALPFALAAPVLGVVRDVAATQVLLADARLFRAIATGFRLVAARPMLLLEYALRSMAGLAVIGLGAMIANRLGGRPGAALIFLALMHQVAAGLRVALRVSWLAAAIRRTR